MQISKVMAASIFITTIVLGIIGGVVSNSVQGSKKAETVKPEIVATYQEREAAYNQLIEQANQKLEKANAELQAMQTQIDQVNQQPSMVKATVSSTITPEKAGEIAQKVVEAGQTVLKTPELVSFEGKTVYEVIFKKGSVYVDAQNGDVVFNATLPLKINADKAAQIASDYLKEQDILNVDEITFRGAPIFRVIFKSGMMVYMDLGGQITYIQKASSNPPTVQASSGSSNSVQANPAPVVAAHEVEDGN
jgi:uncharacterized membrane protein YkoI